nr:HD domain-containing phosphohydrolase [uncultured Eisenbergiella sp.]
MKDRILVVDDMEMNREILKGIFEEDYEVILAGNGREAVEYINNNRGKLAAILLDIVMPEMDGFGVLDYMHEQHLMMSVPVILITSDTSSESRKRGYDLGVSDIVSKPFEVPIVRRRVSNLVDLYHHKNNLEAMVEKQTEEIKEKNRELTEMNYHIIDTLGTIVEFRSMESGNHIYRVRSFTAILLKYVIKYYPEYGMTEDMADIISHASTMHDVGKITVPDSILLKPGKLTQEEFELMKTHTTKGAEIIKEIFVTDNRIFKDYCYNIALSHHEKWDGRGYPQGLKEDEIPLAAQVVSIADVYDALVSDRVYKPAFSYDVAYQMILDGECGQFNPKLMDCFRMARKEFEQKAKELQ